MFTVIRGLEGSGKSRTRNPLGKAYSVMPPIEAFCWTPVGKVWAETATVIRMRTARIFKRMGRLLRWRRELYNHPEKPNPKSEPETRRKRRERRKSSEDFTKINFQKIPLIFFPSELFLLSLRFLRVSGFDFDFAYRFPYS